MVNFSEILHVAIVSGLLGVLMCFIKIKHQDRKIGDVTFFHLSTSILILFPNFLLLIGILLDLTMTNSFFYCCDIHLNYKLYPTSWYFFFQY